MKNKHISCVSTPRTVKKILIFMRMLFILTFGCVLQTYAINSYSQSKALSIKKTSSASKIHLIDIFKQIEKESNFLFNYKDSDIQNVVVDSNIPDGNINEVLDKALSTSGLSYSISDRHITISKLDSNMHQAPSEENSIRGRILDQMGQPLPGVTVSIQGTQTGVAADLNGYYVLKVNSGDVIEFRYLGFKTQTVLIKKQKTLDIILEEDIAEFDEVVVVGMGQQRKASVIGSISSVPIGEVSSPQRSLTSAMSGRIAGATIVQRSGEPGRDDATFWIRGISTFGQNKSPLILVDGVERPMSDLVTEEIESFSILKDASATAVYGVRAANGVVLITTRKGIAQKPSIEVKLEGGISRFTKMPKYLDGANYARLYNEAFGAENYSEDYIAKLESREDIYMYPNVNWFDEVFRKYGNNTNAALSVRGGGDVARYFINASFYNEYGNLRNAKNTDYDTNINLKRYNFRSNIDVTITKTTVLNLELGANLTDLHTPSSNYGLGDNYSPAQAVFYHANRSTPISNPVYVPYQKNSDGEYMYGFGAPSQVGESNPAEVLFGRGYGSKFTSRIMTQFVLNQDLDFLINGLKFKGSFSFDTDNITDLRRTKNASTYSIQGKDPDGEYIVKEVDKGPEFLRYSRNLSNNRAKELKAQLLYDTILKDQHRFGGMAMYYQRDYINAAATSILALPYRKQGVAFRGTYSFDDRYFLEFNVGYNGSENFPKKNRFGWFPAGAVGYLISNESFWNVKPINSLKVRASIGLVGAEALPNGERFGYLSTYGAGLGGYNWGTTDAMVEGVGEDRIGITDLTWEKGLKKNVGIETRMFENTFSLDIDFFHEKRTDILVQRSSLPAITGSNKQPFANLGEMTNKGIEITSEYTNRINQVGFKVYGNFSFTRNKINKMDEAMKTSPYRMSTGQRFGQKFGLVALGLFENQEDIDSSPVQKFGVVRPGDVKYLDLNGDGVIDIEDQKAIGYSDIPEIIYGFGTQFDYKGFDLGIFFRGQANVTYALGGSTFIPFTEGVGKHNLYVQALDRWTEENPRADAFYPRLSNGRSTNNWQASTRNVYNGSLIRLADVELGYTFDKKLIEPLGMKALRFYILGNNLALFSKWKMWDPETGSQNGSNYPNTKKINIGLKATF